MKNKLVAKFIADVGLEPTFVYLSWTYKGFFVCVIEIVAKIRHYCRRRGRNRKTEVRTIDDSQIKSQDDETGAKLGFAPEDELQTLLTDVVDEVADTAAIGPLVVVPGDDLHQVAANDAGQRRVKN